MLLTVIMMSMAMGVGASILAGVAEASLLGPALSTSPAGGMLDVFVTFGTDGFFQAAGFAFTNLPEVLGGVINMLVFNYAVLSSDGAGILGGMTQLFILTVVSGPIIVYMFITLLPWNTSG